MQDQQPTPKPSLIDGLVEFYKHYEPKASMDDLMPVIERSAERFAGNEAGLWEDLYNNYAPGAIGNDPEIVNRLVDRYENPYTAKKKDGGSFGDAPTAEETSSSIDPRALAGAAQTGAAQGSDVEQPVLTPPKDAILPLNPSDYGVPTPQQIRDRAEIEFDRSKDALDRMLNAGTIEDVDYQKQLEEANQKKANVFAITQMKEEGGDDIELDQYQELLDEYMPVEMPGLAAEEVDQEELQAVRKFRSLPKVDDLINDLNASLAEVMGKEDVAEAVFALTQMEQHGMGGNPLDARALRQQAVDKVYDALSEKYPELPKSFYDRYVSAGSQMNEEYSDLSDKDNPYSPERYALVDSYLDANLPNLSDEDRVKYRQAILTDIQSRPIIEEARRKADETLMAEGVMPPEALVEAFEKEKDAAADAYIFEQRAYQMQIQRNAEEAQARLMESDAAFMDESTNYINAQRTILQQLINDGQISEEAANKELQMMVDELNQQREERFVSLSNDLAAQQREIISKAENSQAAYIQNVGSIAEQYNLVEGDDGYSLAEDYLNQYNDLFEKSMRSIQQEKVAEADREFHSLSRVQQVGDSIVLGYIDIMDGFGGGLNWLGFNRIGNALTDQAQLANEKFPRPDLGPFTLRSMANPSWWTDRVVRMMPLTLNLMAVGGGTYASVGSMFTNPTARATISAAVGGGSMRTLESFMEAGFTYQDWIEKGATAEEAGEHASSVFKGNMKLVALDAIQLSSVFGSLPRKIRGSRITSPKYAKLRNGVAWTGITAFNMQTEGMEEAYQEYLQAKTENPMLAFWDFINTNEGREAMVLGALSGGIFSVAGSSVAGQNESVKRLYDDVMSEVRSGKVDPSNIRVRQMQLIESVENLFERGVLSVEEKATALSSIDAVARGLNDNMLAGEPIRDGFVSEYITLEEQRKKYQAVIDATDASNLEKKTAERNVKEIEARINEMVENPNAPAYAIDGVPVSQQSFMSFLGDQDAVDSVGLSKVRVENDHQSLIPVAIATGDPNIVQQVSDGFISSTEDVNTIEEAVEFVQNKVNASDGVRNEDDVQDRWSNLLDVLEQHKSNLSKAAKSESELLNVSAFDKKIAEMNEGERLQAYSQRMSELDQAGVSAEKIEGFASRYPSLQDKFQEEQEVPVETDPVQEGITEAKAENKVEDFFDEFPTVDSLDSIVEINEQYEELQDAYEEETFHDGLIPLMEKAIKEKRGQAASEDIQEAKEEEIGLEEATLKPIDQVVEVNKAARKKLEDKRSELRSSLKGYVDSFRKLGLTPYSEDDIRNDAEALKNLAELAYTEMKLGLLKFSDWIGSMGVQATWQFKSAWAKAAERIRAERDKIIEFDNQLAGFHAWWQSFRQTLQDSDIVLKRFQAYLKEELGVDMSEGMNFYQRRELEQSRLVDRLRIVNEKILGAKRGTVGAKRINKESWMGRLRAAFPGVDSIFDQLSLYAYALHAPDFNKRVYENRKKERDARIAELQEKIASTNSTAARNAYISTLEDILNDMDPSLILIEDASGMSDSRAAEIREHFERQDDFETMKSFLDEFMNDVVKARLDVLLDYGLINEEKHSKLLSGEKEGSDVVFSNYVPLKISDESYAANHEPVLIREGASKDGLNSLDLGTASGHFMERNNPLAQAMLELQQAYALGEANRTKGSLKEMIEAQPDNNYWQVVSSRVLVDIDDQGRITSAKDLVSREIKENSITYVDNGKLNYLYIKPIREKTRKGHFTGRVIRNPIVAQAKKSYKAQNEMVNSILQASRFYINIKRNLTTTYNIAFGIPNFTRDLPEAIVNITSKEDDLGLKNIRRNILSRVPKSFAPILRNGLGNTKMDKTWRLAQTSGMPIAWRSYSDPSKGEDDFTRQIREFHESKGAKKLPALFWTTAMSRIELVNDMLENANRLAVFSALIDQFIGNQIDTYYPGLSKSQRAAKIEETIEQLTDLKSSSSEFLNSIKVETAASIAKNITLNFEKRGDYTNQINALYLFANAGIQGVARGGELLFTKKGRYVLGAVTAFSMLNAFLLDYLDPDDESDVYSSFDRDNNYFIANPVNPSEPFRIPKPYSFVRVFSNIGEMIYDGASGRTSWFDTANRMVSNLHTVVDPIGGAQDNIVSAYIPSVFRVPAEIWMNKKWNGNPITFYSDDKKGSEQYTRQTAEWLKSFTGWLDAQTDWWNTGEGAVSLSPANMQYFIEDFFGAIGGETMNVADMISDGFDINKMPVARRFFVDIDSPSGRMKYVYRLYAFQNRRATAPLTEREEAIMRESVRIMRSEQLLDKKSRSRIVGKLEEKYGINL
jgi:hypothetical protein